MRQRACRETRKDAVPNLEVRSQWLGLRQRQRGWRKAGGSKRYFGGRIDRSWWMVGSGVEREEVRTNSQLVILGTKHWLGPDYCQQSSCACSRLGLGAGIFLHSS